MGYYFTKFAWNINFKEETMLKFLNKKTQFLSAAIMTGMMSSVASAQDFNNYTSGLSDRTNSVTDIIAYICYMGGAALAALGIVGLKQHVENPGQNPMKNGLAKLGFGGMLLAIPTITSVVLDTTDESTEAVFKGFGSEASF